MNVILSSNYLAEAAVAASLFVKFGAADGQVVPAAAATDSIIGVSEQIDAAINERVDVVHMGIVFLKAGGNITRGGEVTSDAAGKAVAAAPGAGVNNRIGAIALQSAVNGDIFRALLTPGLKQG